MRVYTDREGLPQNAVEALAVDPEGYLWVGTQSGAAFYNGRRWTPVRLPNPEESQWIRCMLRAKDGSLWFGRDQGGICRYQGGNWKQFGSGEGLPNVKVHALLEREDGTLLTGTSGGLFRLQGGRWIPVTDEGGDTLPPVLSLMEGKGAAHALWVGTERGLGLEVGGRWEWHGTLQGLPSPAIWSLHQSTDGTFWAGTARGLAKRDQGRWRTIGAAEGIPANVVNRIIETEGEDGQRTLYFAMDEGLGLYEGGRWRFLNTKNGLPNQVVRSLLAERQAGGPSTVWLGTFGGLVRLQRRAWFTLDMHSGLPDDVVFCLQESFHPAAFWVGTLGGGLVRFQGGQWKTYGPRSEVPDRHILAVIETRREPGGPAIWVATRGGGVLRMQGERWTRHTEIQGLPDGWVYSLHEEMDPSKPWGIWAGTRKGLAFWDGHRWTDPKVPFPPAPVMGFLETVGPAGRNQLWVATRGEGLLLLEAGKWRRFGRDDGLSDNRAMSLLEAKGADGSRWLWVGAYQGISRKRLDRAESSWETLTGERLPGLPSQLIYQLRMDPLGRIYAFTDHGVARLTPRVPSPEDPAVYSVYTFTVGDGLPSNGCTQGSSLVDSGGRIWTGTVAGAAFLDPAQEQVGLPASPLKLERVKIAGREMPLLEGREIPRKESSLVFEYALLRYLREEDIRYSTQLEGLEAAPSDWSPDGKREYPTLPAGRYVFKVWAKDHTGSLAGPISYTFRVLPPLWQTWWARLGFALAAVVLVAGVVRYRTALLRARTRELEQGVNDRTEALSAAVGELQEARDEAMGATLAKSEILATVSHEIRTPLNAILGMADLLAGTTLTPEQRDYSGTLQRSAEHLLQILNDVLDFSKMEANRMNLEKVPFNLQDEAEDCLGLMAEAAQRKGLELACLFHSDTPVQVVGDPVRLRQVLVNLLGNAIKFTPKGEITLSVSEKGPTGAGSWIRFEVRDQGLGIDAAILPKLFSPYAQADASTPRRFGGTGLGLAICKRLVDLMEGRIGADSEPGMGSTFWFELPLHLQADPWQRLDPIEGSPTVLLASASPASRQGILLALESWGIRPRSVDRLEEIPNLLQGNSELVPLLIVDMGLLPGGEGTASSGLSGWGLPGEVPLILLASLRQLQAAEQARLAGRAEYLVKPVRRARLHKAIRKVLGLELPDSPAPANPRHNPRGRVLVVDDNEANRKVALLQLQGLGYSAVAAENAEEAMASLAGGPFDAVLMDCEMPGVSGFEATRRIREQEAPDSRQPIIALTAHLQDGVDQRCREAGMDAYLAKPLRMEALKETLERWIGGADPGPASGGAESKEAPSGSHILDSKTWEGLKHLETLTGPGAIADLVDAFLTDAPSRFQRLELAIAAGDGESASRDAHDLKANAATLGAFRLAGVMAEIEAVARGEGSLDLALALARARTLFEEAHEALTERMT
jgi:signal transduction histidine kinase/ligand-binding sensor domain-containing protein/DNA-binding response OmpR family regulator